MNKYPFTLKGISFLLDILLICISNVMPLSSFPSTNPHSIDSSCLYDSAPQSTLILLPHHPSIPLQWSIKPSQDQRPLLPLMPDKAPLAPSVLPLIPPLGSLCSVQWSAVSICICISQDLAEPPRRQM
jgi:hypothetical protein